MGGNAKVELHLLNYLTKAHFKKATGVVISEFAKKTDLAVPKLDVDKLDIDKLKTVSVDLSKWSNVVNSDIVKKAGYDKLVTNIHAINNSGFVLKSTDKSDYK